VHRKTVSNALGCVILIPAVVACSDATFAAASPRAAAETSQEVAASHADPVADTPVGLKRAMLTVTGMK